MDPSNLKQIGTAETLCLGDNDDLDNSPGHYNTPTSDGPKTILWYLTMPPYPKNVPIFRSPAYA